jgi:saccharopine dehydrogenase-like NADP-dependent oxidoreductase
VNEESAWLSAEAKKSVLTDQLGVTSSEDIKYLGTDEIQSLARNLKIAKRNRFLAQFPGNFDNN